MNSPGDTGNASRAPAEEQEICLECGICCDGTLFSSAWLKADERGRLPQWMEENSFSQNGEELFLLPCGYFSGRCTIYERKKAYVCSAFRCRVLKDLSEGRITRKAALVTVRDAVRTRDEISALWGMITGHTGRIHFRKILAEIGRIQGEVPGYLDSPAEFDLLVARCNIFAVLLIKFFREEKDFDRFVMK